MIQIVAAPPFRQMSHETILRHKLLSRAVVATPNQTAQRVDAEMSHKTILPNKLCSGAVVTTPNPAVDRVDMEMFNKMALGSDQQAAMVAPERGRRFQVTTDDVTDKVTFARELALHLTAVALPLPEAVLLQLSDIQVFD